MTMMTATDFCKFGVSHPGSWRLGGSKCSIQFFKINTYPSTGGSLLGSSMPAADRHFYQIRLAFFLEQLIKHLHNLLFWVFWLPYTDLLKVNKQGSSSNLNTFLFQNTLSWIREHKYHQQYIKSSILFHTVANLLPKTPRHSSKIDFWYSWACCLLIWRLPLLTMADSHWWTTVPWICLISSYVYGHHYIIWHDLLNEILFPLLTLSLLPINFIACLRVLVLWEKEKKLSLLPFSMQNFMNSYNVSPLSYFL